MLTCKTIDWQMVKQKAENCDWARASAAQLKKDFDYVSEVCPNRPPLEESAWAHYYFCSKCSSRLIFSFDSPHSHYCGFCKEHISGELYDGAWRKAVHGSIVSNMERAAVLAHLEPQNPIYAQYIKTMVLFYVDHYRDYPEHGDHAGIGKVMPQSLTEAIFIIALEQILRMVSDLCLFSESEWAHIQNDLFALAIPLLRPQINKIHNIHAWMVSAICACASVLGDKALLNEMIYGKLGWKEQLEQGVNADGVWYEISPGYHFYSLQALLSGARIARENGFDICLNPRLMGMGTSLYRIAYPSGVLPAYNDTSYSVFINDYAAQFEELLSWQPSQEYKNLLSFCYAQPVVRGSTRLNAMVDYYMPESTGFARNSIAAMLYGEPVIEGNAVIPTESVLLPNSGIAVLRKNGLRVGLKFSPNGGGHDHCDKLSLEFAYNNERFCADTGTAGYSLAMTNEWCRTPLAHNMVVLDQNRQALCNAELISFTDNCVEASSAEAYPGAVLKRKLQLTDTGFIDCFTVKASERRCIDYVFRCFGNASSSVKMEDAVPFDEPNGYNQLSNIKKTVTDDAFTLTWTTDTRQVALSVEACPGTELFLANCFGVNKTQPQMILIVRRYSDESVFNCTCSLSGLPDNNR